MKPLALKISLLAVLPLISTSAFAAQMNYIVQAQLGAGATDVPTLSGTMLVLLSLVLFAVAFKFAKQKTGANKLFVTLIGVTALSIGGGGFKLVSDARAISVPTVLDESGSVDLEVGLNRFSNEFSGKTIKITGFVYTIEGSGDFVCQQALVAITKCTEDLVLQAPEAGHGLNLCALSCQIQAN